jgi:hypothetical protein
MIELIELKSISNRYPNCFDIFKVAGDDSIVNEKQRFFKWMNKEGCTIRLTYIPERFVWDAEVRYDKGSGSMVNEQLLGFRNYEEAFTEAVETGVRLLEFKFKPKDHQKTWLDAVTVEAWQRQQAKEFWSSDQGLRIKRNSDEEKRRKKGKA